MNKIARIHVNQHVIKANAKNGENNPIFTIKQGGSNTYAHNVKVKGEMELVYSPDKPLSCGAKVWIETRGEISMSNSFATSTEDINTDTLANFPQKIDKNLKSFLRKKQRKIQNKNKLSACLSS